MPNLFLIKEVHFKKTIKLNNEKSKGLATLFP